MLRRTLMTAWLLSALACGTAMADPISDCNQFEDPQRQIKGCTAFIRRGGLDTEALASAYINRGIARGQLRKPAEAIKDFSEALRLDPKNALAYYNRGNANFDTRKFDAAAADYEQALTNDPGFALAYYNRGLVFELRGDRGRAIADFAQALSLDPELGSAKQKLELLGVKPGIDTASRPAG